jgi:hypothetical protein
MGGDGAPQTTRLHESEAVDRGHTGRSFWQVNEGDLASVRAGSGAVAERSSVR